MVMQLCGAEMVIVFLALPLASSGILVKLMNLWRGRVDNFFSFFLFRLGSCPKVRSVQHLVWEGTVLGWGILVAPASQMLFNCPSNGMFGEMPVDLLPGSWI